jgi:hypothetical protein
MPDAKLKSTVKWTTVDTIQDLLRRSQQTSYMKFVELHGTGLVKCDSCNADEWMMGYKNESKIHVARACCT